MSLICLTTFASAVAAESTTPAFSPGIVDWQGRVQVDGTAVSFDWLGVQFKVKVTGASYLKATFNTSHMGKGSHARLRSFVSINGDGYPLPHSEVPLVAGVTDYILAAGSGFDTVTVMNNQSPAYIGTFLTLVSLSTDGTFVKQQQQQQQSRAIEFVGDSITAATNLRRPAGDPAYGIPQAPTCGDYGLYSDYALSYSNQLCQAFGANCSTIAWGGKGMYKNCCDHSTTMPEYYLQTLANQPGIKAQAPYNFAASGYAPDVVVIALGTNDFSHCRSSPCEPGFADSFTKTYVDFMVNVTKWYGKPDIEFFCGVGPITVNYLNATAAAVKQAVALGIKAQLVDQEACAVGGGGCEGCATHPGVAGHKKMYEMAYPAIKKTMGW